MKKMITDAIWVVLYVLFSVTYSLIEGMVYLAGLCLILGLPASLIYVAGHFIMKYW